MKNNILEQVFEKTMVDVIKTSEKIREYLLDENIKNSEKKQELKILQTALEANKNIVSASCVQVNIEKLVK